MISQLILIFDSGETALIAGPNIQSLALHHRVGQNA